MRKKALSLLVCAAMLCTFTVGCGTTEPSSSSSQEAPIEASVSAEQPVNAPGEEAVQMRYVAPGSHFEKEDEILALVNEKLQKDGVNIEVSFTRIGWDAWDQKTQLMIASGEPFEMLHVMQDLKTAGLLYGQGAIMPLDSYIVKDEFSGLRETFTEQLWQEVSSQGKILAVPALTTADEGKVYGDIYYRKDIADRLGLKEPTTVDGVIEFAKALQDEISKETGKKVYSWGGTGRPADWYLRSLAGDYFYVDTNLSMVKVTQEGKVESWVESEEFKNSCELYQRLNEEGLVHPDALTLDHEYASNEISYGRWAIGFEIGAPANYERALSENVPGAEIGIFRLAPEKNDFIEFYTYNCNAVPTTSPNPEAALQFLQWLYTDKENHDLFLYGVEGETYTSTAPNRYSSIMGKDGQALYRYDDWQIAFLPLRRFDEVLSDEVVEMSSKRRDLDENAVVSVHTGFMFESSTVSDAAANLAAESTRVLAPMKYGFVSYEDGYESAISTLKAAGLDEYLAEYARQFEEFMKFKK